MLLLLGRWILLLLLLLRLLLLWRRVGLSSGSLGLLRSRLTGELLLGRVAGPELGGAQLLQVECLSLLDEKLPLVLQRLSLPVHDGLQLFKVPELDLQLLHLSFDEQGNEAFDLALFHGRQMFGLDGGGTERARSC